MFDSCCRLHADPMTEPPPPSAPADDTISAAPRSSSGVFRSEHDRYVAGVSGGVAERVGVDPLFIRLGLVAATLFLSRDNSGAAAVPLVAYLAAWLFLPTRSNRSLVRRINNQAAQQETLGAGAVFGLALFGLSRPSLIWAGLLFAIAMAMLTDRPTPAEVQRLGDNSPPVGPPPPLSAADRARTWGRSLRGAPLLQNEPGARAQRPPARSPKLWPLTTALLFAYALTCVLLDNLLAGGVDPGVAVNGALLIVGVVMVLSGWRGRAWLTLLAVVPLVPFWIAFTLAGVDRVPNEPFVAAPGGYDSGDVVQASQPYGGLLVDLRRAELPSSGEITVEVGVTVGQVDVWVPKEAQIRLTGQVGFAEVDVYQENDWYSRTNDLLANWGLNRNYEALGRACFENVADEIGLRYVAEISNVNVAPTANAFDVADSIEAAGYPRPILQPTEFFEPIFDLRTGEMLIDEFTGEPIFEPVYFEEWIFQSNNNGGLCTPEPAPDNPLVITIDATVGVGNLKVHRV